MMRSGGNVQFFGLAEDDWKYEHDNAGTVTRFSGFIASVTAGMPTAAPPARSKGENRLPAKRVGNIEQAPRVEPTTVIASALTVPASAKAAWGIMVPKS